MHHWIIRAHTSDFEGSQLLALDGNDSENTELPDGNVLYCQLKNQQM